MHQAAFRELLRSAYAEWTREAILDDLAALRWEEAHADPATFLQSLFWRLPDDRVPAIAEAFGPALSAHRQRVQALPTIPD